MNLNEISRREAMHRMVAGLSFILLPQAIISMTGCEKNPTSPGNKNPTKINSNPHGDYETVEVDTDENGHATIFSNLNDQSLEARTSDEYGNPVISKIKYYNDREGNMVLISLDKQSERLPGLYAGLGGGSFLVGRDYSIDIINLLKDGREFKEIYASFLEDAPSFDENHFLKIPGITYNGDWAFNEVRNFSGFLNKTSVILFSLFPGLLPISVATSTSEKIADKVNDMIDFVNTYTEV